MKPTVAQAQDLVDHFGSIRATARALDVARSTVFDWLHPEAKVRRNRAHYEANAESLCAQHRDRYWNSSPLRYARLRLQNRRVKALMRMRRRHQTEEV